MTIQMSKTTYIIVPTISAPHPKTEKSTKCVQSTKRWYRVRRRITVRCSVYIPYKQWLDSKLKRIPLISPVLPERICQQVHDILFLPQVPIRQQVTIGAIQWFLF